MNLLLQTGSAEVKVIVLSSYSGNFDWLVKKGAAICIEKHMSAPVLAQTFAQLAEELGFR
jgi:hypothetical protein